MAELIFSVNNLFNVYSDGTGSLSGAFTISGQLAVTGQVVRPNQTGNLIDQGMTGGFYLNSNPSGYITGFNSGLYALSSNTGSFITTGQTGAYYPRIGNPSGFVTGSVVRPTETGTFNSQFVSKNEQSHSIIPGLSFAGNQSDSTYPIWGGFMSNALTNWTRRGGVINVSFTGEVSGLAIPEIMVSPYFTNQAWRDNTNLNRSNTGVVVIELTGVTFDVPSHAAWAPFLTTRLTTQPASITGIKVEFLDNSNNWNAVASGSPTFTGVIWAGPYFSLTGFPLKGVKFTLDIASGSSVINIAELGIFNKNYLKGTNFYAFQYSSPVFNIISGSGIKCSGTNVVLATQTGQFYPRSGNLSGYITGLSTGDFITTGQTGAYYPRIGNPSGFLTGNVVFTTGGSQTISGEKTFKNSITVPSISSTQGYSIELSIGRINDNGPNISIDWENRTLNDIGDTIELDWRNNILSGNWNSQGLQISGKSVISQEVADLRYVKTGASIEIIGKDFILRDTNTGFRYVPGAPSFYLQNNSKTAVIDLEGDYFGTFVSSFSGFNITGKDARFDNLWVNNVKITGNGSSNLTGITGVSNLGSGSGIASGVSNNILYLKSLKTGIGINISGNSTDLTLSTNLNYQVLYPTGNLIIDIPAKFNIYQNVITGTIGYGNWLANATISMGDNPDVSTVVGKIWNGNSGNQTIWAAVQGGMYSNPSILPLVGIINVTGATGTIFNMSILSNNYLTVYSTPTIENSGLTNKATQLTLVRIG